MEHLVLKQSGRSNSNIKKIYGIYRTRGRQQKSDIKLQMLYKSTDFQ